MIILTPEILKKFIWSVRLNAFTVQPITSVDIYYDKLKSEKNIETSNNRYKYSQTGYGLYSLTSCINHNCQPNAAVVPQYDNYR